MKLDKIKIYKGNIKRCDFYEETEFTLKGEWEDKYDGFIVKKDAVLYQLGNRKYVDISNIRLFNILNLQKFSIEKYPYEIGDYYVEEESLENYFDGVSKEDTIKLRKLKKIDKRSC